MEPTVFAALAVTAGLAAFVQAATGFGFALIAVPVMLALTGSLAVVPVTAVVSVVLSLVLLPRLAGAAPRRLLLHLAAGSLAGFPLGLAAFRAADVAGAKIAVGALITGFALLLLAREWRAGENAGGPASGGGEGAAFAPRMGAELGVGAVSGAMAAALAMPGPAVVLYLMSRRAGKAVSRAATLILFVFSYAAVMGLHALWGGMDAAAWWLAAGLAPVVIAGAFAGQAAAGRLSEARFRLAVLVILVASGLYAAGSALPALAAPPSSSAPRAAPDGSARAFDEGRKPLVFRRRT